MLTEQPGRLPRLENVSFKKLSKGTLVLGVVFKVCTSFTKLNDLLRTSNFVKDYILVCSSSELSRLFLHQKSDYYVETREFSIGNNM